MGEEMCVAYVASLPDTELNWRAGSAALEEIADPLAFGWHPFDLELEDEFVDEDGEIPEEPSLKFTDVEVLKTHGRRVLDDLKNALEGRCTTSLTIGGYCAYLAGGLSNGEAPSDEYLAICASEGLPGGVLKAVGFVLKPSEPPSRRAGAQGDVTDTDVVDAIALGLGTKPKWRGADELTWIANAIANVRPHPGDIDPVEYYEDFTGQSGFDPLEDSFLSGYVGDQAAGDDHQDEKAG
ncbi:hypothetical protein [Kribbella sp. DT2]|uniref:hypothetical protein n=1 Tax=Kribbella sp. DT2 TaxID=3393427 RepID=UPI003CF8A170